MRILSRLAMVLSVLAFEPALARQVELGAGSVVETVKRLRPGDYVWAPEIAPQGPTLLMVNLKSQRAVLYRNGVPIAASTVSTGRPGYRTPTGVFTILQKRVEHYSSTYDNAPMPYMQRLTWRGIALHAGQLPGYPASHGCIRLPLGFAKLLYGVTNLGMTVAITDGAATPRIAPAPEFTVASSGIGAAGSTVFWQPERSPTGPVSIIVSASDRKAVVIRNGIQIGAAPVTVMGAVNGTWAYVLSSIDDQGQHWSRIALSGQKSGDERHVERAEWQRFRAVDQFKRAVAGIVTAGTTVVVTADSLDVGEAGSPATIIETEPADGG